MDNLMAYVPTQYIPYVTGMVTIACVLATMIPPPPVAPKGFLQKCWYCSYRAVNTVALAFGHATNATDPTLKGTIVTRETIFSDDGSTKAADPTLKGTPPHA